MRIAMVSRMVHREGGVQACVWELAKRFARGGHQVTLYTNLCPDLPDSSVMVHRIPMLFSRSFRDSQSPWVKAFQVWSFAWLSRFMVRRGDFDIVHVQGDSLAKADLRTAHSCHKAWIKSDLSRNPSLGNRLRKRFNPLHAIVLLIEYFNYVMSGARQVIAVSMTVKQQLMDNYTIDEARISIIPAGVEYAEFAAPEGFDIRQFRQQVGIPNGSPVMVFVGWEFRRKGLSTILEAMTHMTTGSPHLLVVGGDQERPFARQAEDFGIRDRVHFVGAQSDVRPYFWGSDVFIFPTRYEPFGMAVAEAMAAGMPVITSRCAGIAAWIDNGKEGVLLDDPFDAEELATALDRVLENPDNMAAMGRAAQQKAKIFDWDRIAASTLEVYRSVSKSKSRGSR